MRKIQSAKVSKILRLLSDYMESNEGKSGSEDLIRAAIYFKLSHIINGFQKEPDTDLHCLEH